jgi:hypothetical protein
MTFSLSAAEFCDSVSAAQVSHRCANRLQMPPIIRSPVVSASRVHSAACRRYSAADIINFSPFDVLANKELGIVRIVPRPLKKPCKSAAAMDFTSIQHIARDAAFV